MNISTRLVIPAAMLSILLAGCSSTETTAEAEPESSLTLETYTADDYGYATTSTIIYGKNDAILIDPNFLKRDALKVADMIRATGKNLTTIYTTHAHPDHFMGVETILAEFPNARYVALPQVAERIATAWPNRREFWYPTYGDELPGPDPILPEPLAKPELTLEGETFPITGELIGDGPGNSFVWIPSLRAVVAGDTVFYERHLGVPADPAPWYETLAMIEALNPEIVVPGHKDENTPTSPAALDWMREYITDFNNFKAESSSAEELKEKMLAKYGNIAHPDRLDQAVTAAFAPPAKGKGKGKAK